MSTRNVDYTGLIAPVTKHDITTFKSEARAAGRSWASMSSAQLVSVIAAVVFIVIGTVVVVPVTGSLFFLLSTSPVYIIVIAVFGLVILGMLVYALVAAVSGGKWARWTKLDRFARANGFVFSASDPNPSYPGAIFSVGSARTATEHLRTTEGRFIDMGNYTYTTGSGKNRRTHNWGFMAFALDRSLPHMVLDSKANNGLFGGSNLPAVFSKDQVLSLEGDFDTYFTLYCPAQYERDALYVFTPDLMALLIDNAAPYDVEVVDRWMFVYSSAPFDTDSPATYQRLLQIVDTVGAKALTQSARYVDERVGDFSANIVATPGRRLKRGFPIAAAIGVVAVAAVFMVPRIIEAVLRF